MQYERRFRELYQQVASKLEETKKFYSLFNTLEEKKGFLSKPPPEKPPRRKKNALPDDAFIPAESYDFCDDDGVCEPPASTALCSA